jgi:orotidine-5'-phosphate decarboxylase
VIKKPESRVVLSLDQMSKARALKIAEEATGLVWGFKVHDLLFHYGAEIVYELKQFGKVIADARLWGNRDEVKGNIRILRTAGADIVTVLNSADYLDEDVSYLASVDCVNDEHFCVLRGYGYCVDVSNDIQDQRTTFNVRCESGTDLFVYGREVIAEENFGEILEKLAGEISA